MQAARLTLAQFDEEKLQAVGTPEEWALPRVPDQL